MVQDPKQSPPDPPAQQVSTQPDPPQPPPTPPPPPFDHSRSNSLSLSLSLSLFCSVWFDFLDVSLDSWEFFLFYLCLGFLGFQFGFFWGWFCA
jgi:hypothetical protein